jgi:hypothetical protein
MSARWEPTIENIVWKSTGSAGKLDIISLVHLSLHLVPNPSAPTRDEHLNPHDSEAIARQPDEFPFIISHSNIPHPFRILDSICTVSCRKRLLLVSAGTTMCLVRQVLYLVCRIIVLKINCSSSHCPDILWVPLVALVNLLLSLSEKSSSSSVGQGGNKELHFCRLSANGYDYRHRSSMFGSVPDHFSGR